MPMESAEQRGARQSDIPTPKWVMTFADMMTLLLCFFVLLLSFSEMNVRRYKQIAGAMAEGFGVSMDMSGEHVPMGKAVALREFAPDRVIPVPISESYSSAGEQPAPIEQAESVQSADEAALAAALKQKIRELVGATQADAAELATQLRQQIARGEVEVETNGRRIVLRIREKGSFSSGSADLKEDYQQLMRQIRDQLQDIRGSIEVIGHTDDIPISTERFRSNWELSSSRAVSVAEQLLQGDVLNPRRFAVSGFADTRPIVPNDSAANRAINRRVEIVIRQGVDETTRAEFETLKSLDPEYLRSLGIDENFELGPRDVF